MFREAFKFIDIKRKVLCVGATWKSIATDGRRRYSVSEHQQQQQGLVAMVVVMYVW